MFKKTQKIFDILLESINEGVLIIDRDHIITEANSTAKFIFGFDKNHLINKNFNYLFPSNFHKHIDELLESIFTNSKQLKLGEHSELFAIQKDGNIIQIIAEFNVFKFKKQVYALVLITDISVQKEIEVSLMLKSEALQSAANGILITDALKPDNPIIYFNQAFENLTGYSESEILNKNCRFLQGKDRDQEELHKLRTAIKKGESCEAILRNYKKDGTLFWNHLFITPIINSKGVVTNFIGIQNDITKRLKAEEERNHLAKIFDESLNEIYVFELENLNFINANYGAQKNIGYSLDELSSMKVTDITSEYTETRFRQSLQVLLKKNVEKLEFETVHKRKDGTTYPVEAHLQLSKIGDKNVIVAITLDITERKNYTRRLENTVKERTEQLQNALNKEKELNELKTKFLSMVSHEFKTPLSGILTSAYLIKKYSTAEEQDKREKHIKIISQKVDYLTMILDDFLSLENLESGTYNYKIKKFHISRVINEVVYNANMILKEGQQIIYPENIDDLIMNQDEKILELILSNILNNAIKYSKQNTKIKLSVKQMKNETVFSIEDSGLGIPEQDIDKIFTRYFRAENVLHIQGTGIGLNLVKSHVENMGGSIFIKSEENKGTIVIVKLPTTLDYE